MTVKINQASVERLRCTVVTDSDPSSATIDFSVTAPGAKAPTSWHAGEWAASAVARGGGWFSRVARTPLIGQGPLDLAPNTYQLWARLVIGSEQAVLPVEEFEVR